MPCDPKEISQFCCFLYKKAKPSASSLTLDLLFLPTSKNNRSGLRVIAGPSSSSPAPAQPLNHARPVHSAHSVPSFLLPLQPALYPLHTQPLPPLSTSLPLAPTNHSFEFRVMVSRARGDLRAHLLTRPPASPQGYTAGRTATYILMPRYVRPGTHWKHGPKWSKGSMGMWSWLESAGINHS